MSNIDTIWTLEPHTGAKHLILEEYLKAWFPILSTWNKRIVYLDCFAGPGIYSKGEDGSPVIAIRVAKDHTLANNFDELTFVFIEKDPLRVNTLKQVLKEKFPDLPSAKWKYAVHQGEFDPSINSELDAIEKQGLKLAPTFAFIDPFGYSEFPMKTIKRLLSHDKCEVLITFMIDFINRFTDDAHANALDKLFETKDWRQVRNIVDDPRSRQQFFLKLYEQQLKNVAGAKYTRTFEMVRSDGHTVYYLVFATKAWQGIKVIKDAMFKVDARNTFRFSDREDPNQTYLTKFTETDFWIPDVAGKIHDEFKGKKVNVQDIEIFVITKTLYRFKKKAILEYLEKNKIIKVEGRKVSGYNYPERCMIEFSKD